jgi:antitoxin HicB
MKRKGIKRKIYNYIAIFDPAEEGGFNVSFPAFPGCVTFGSTFEEAKEKAKEVLELWIEELFMRRESIPLKRSRPIVDEVEVSIPGR